ncbi:MAG: glycosyltransferase family 2 protein [Candidatus Promineifilaceae bacterium]|nr:glycosyltransferase family 2 protein [Candidatus Promineifilaceae bacterium]
MADLPLVAAVVVNWNGREETLACLASLVESRGVRLMVVVVDNGSTDGSVTAIQARYPTVEVIALPSNRHFAAGANVGLRHGLAQGADYLWLLNNDVLLDPDALAEKVRIAESDSRIGIIGARLVHPTNPPGVIVGANCDLRTGAIIEPAPPTGPRQNRLAVDYVWGCAMLIRAAVLIEVGFFDERLVAYFEDTDMCLRAARHGWQTTTALKATVHHVGSRSANRRFLQQMFLRGRNWWRVYWRHAPARDRKRLFVWLWGYRLPHLLWSTLVTVIVRTLRPRGRPIRLR